MSLDSLSQPPQQLQENRRSNAHLNNDSQSSGPEPLEFGSSTEKFWLLTPNSPLHSSKPQSIGGVIEPDYQETWLRMWTNSMNPQSASCVDAFDSIWYCFSPPAQLRHIHRTAQPSDCAQQQADFKTCLAMRVEPQQEKQVEMLRERRRIVDSAHGRQLTEGPIWRTRTKPPANFGLAQAPDAIHKQIEQMRQEIKQQQHQQQQSTQ